MRSLFFIFIAVSGICYAQTPKEMFDKYDFTTLAPKQEEIKFNRIDVDVWDRCDQCDCPQAFLQDVLSEETVDAITYRHSHQIIEKELKITATKKDDVYLIANIKPDCKVYSIITIKEDHPKAKVPCDPNCAEPLPQKHELDVNLNKPEGCKSDGATLPFIFSVLFLLIMKGKQNECMRKIKTND